MFVVIMEFINYLSSDSGLIVRSNQVGGHILEKHYSMIAIQNAVPIH